MSGRGKVIGVALLAGLCVLRRGLYAPIKQELVWLGTGKMGLALCGRLLQTKANVLGITVWNRSGDKCAPLVQAGARQAHSVREALETTPMSAPIAIMLLSYQQTRTILDKVKGLLKGRTIICLCSGNPDEAKTQAAYLASLGCALYVDACYSGGPSQAREGKGTLIISADACKDAKGLYALNPVLSDICVPLGKVAFAGGVGAGKALNYGVVDMYLISYLGFLSAMSMLKSEGVHDPSLVLELMQARMNQNQAVFSALHPQMVARDYKAQSASLGTWLHFLEDRLPYLRANDIPSDVTCFLSSLIRRAAGGEGRAAHPESASTLPLIDQDYIRLQELFKI